jgi:hypothetical protein
VKWVYELFLVAENGKIEEKMFDAKLIFVEDLNANY